MHAVALSGDCPHPPLKELIFKGSLIGSTPLILACHCGDFNSVERIIEHWEADVNKAAVYYTYAVDCNLLYQHSIKIDSTTPLFVAASNGHTKIVRYLINKGADVSAKTHSVDMECFDGLTPLYGVVSGLCFGNKNVIHQTRMKEESAGIVRLLLESGADASLLSSRPSDGSPIWMKEMCRTDIITELVNRGMDLKQRDQSTNESVLHYWASNVDDQEESLIIVKLLIDRGADLLALDDRGFTPLLKAATGRSSEFPNVNILDFLLERSDYSRAEKIEAMELAGAVILDNEKNLSQFHKGFNYWRRALQFRQTDINGSDPIQKTRSNLESARTAEWITSADLENVIEHPETYMIQSFLVRLRIFSYKSWKAIESTLFEFYTLDKIFKELRILGRLVDIFDIIWTMLETLRLFYPSESIAVQQMAEKVVVNFLLVLTNLHYSSTEFWDANIIKTSLKLVVATTEFHGLSIGLLFQFVAILSAVPPKLLDDAIIEILSQLIRLDLRAKHELSLLHKACFYNCDKVKRFAIFRLLLQAGSNPNAIDNDGNASLHLLVLLNRKLDDYTNVIARLLLDFGAELSLKNKNGKTVVDLMIQKNARQRQLNQH